MHADDNVSMSKGIITTLTHVPIYKPASTMALYKYQPTPIYLTNGNKVQATIHPDDEIIGINSDKTLYSSYSAKDLKHNCNILHDKYYCSKHSIITRIDKPNCILGLYQQNKAVINDTCSMSFNRAHEYVKQLNQTTFLIFAPKPTLLEVNCNFGFHQSNWVNQTVIVNMQNGCKGSIENYIFSTPIQISETVEVKLTGKIFEILPMMKLDDKEMEMLEDIIESSKITGIEKIKVRNIKKLFDLRILKRTHKTTSIVMKILSSATAFVITMLIIYIIYKTTKCITKNSSKQKCNHMQTKSMTAIEGRIKKEEDNENLIETTTAAFNRLEGSTIKKSDA